MLKNFSIGVGVLLLAFGILFVSVMRATQVKFDVNGSGSNKSDYESYEIPYQLAHSGSVLPGHFLWPLKVIRDRVWLLVTTDETEKANLLLLFADKRLASSLKLAESGDYDNALSTLVKAENYLEMASHKEKETRESGNETQDTLRLLSYASLKHFDVINSMIYMFPDNARVIVMGTQKMPKLVYETSRDALFQKGLLPPENPFEW